MEGNGALYNVALPHPPTPVLHKHRGLLPAPIRTLQRQQGRGQRSGQREAEGGQWPLKHMWSSRETSVLKHVQKRGLMSLTSICTVSRPSPASRASMVNSTGKLAGTPEAFSPGPLARTLLASWAGNTLILNGLKRGKQSHILISQISFEDFVHSLFSSLILRLY